MVVSTEIFSRKFYW